MTLLAVAAAYVLGSVPTAYLLAKRLKGIDIRTVGSGNVGATNASRVLGARGGALVFVLDALKGLIAATCLARLASGLPPDLAALVCGSAAVVGHIFSCFLRFQGGKGVATVLGVLLGASPSLLGSVVAVWAVGFALSRGTVSVGSLAAAAAIPIAAWALRLSPAHILITAALGALIIARHRSNIERLRRGTERRLFTSRRESD